MGEHPPRGFLPGSPREEGCCAACAYFGWGGQRVLLLLRSLSLVHGTAVVFLLLDGGGFFPISFYIMSYASVYIRGPKAAAVFCMGSGFAPGSEMKVNSGLVSSVEDVVLGGARSFRFWKGLFPHCGWEGIILKGINTKPPLSVSGFTSFHQVFLNLCKRGASTRNSR